MTLSYSSFFFYWKILSYYIRICSTSCECDRCAKNGILQRNITLFCGQWRFTTAVYTLLISKFTCSVTHCQTATQKNNEAAYCWINTLDYYRPFKHYKLILLFFCNFKYKKRIFKYTDLLGIWYLFHLIYQEKLNNWLTIIGWVLLLKVG